MRNVMLIVIFVLMGFLVYRAWTAQGAGQGQVDRATGVIEGVVSSGRDVGRNAGKALEGVRFPGS